MHSSSELALDDILNRSLRLETPLNFRIPPDFRSIYQQSRNILSDFDINKQAREKGQLLLARQQINEMPVDISPATKMLEKIDPSKVILTEKLSFSDKCAGALKTSISESLEKSSKKDDFSDDFIFNNLSAQMKENETLIHRCIFQSEPISTSQFDSPQNGEEKMELNLLARFYANNLFGTNFVDSMESAIRRDEAQEYFSRDVQTALADTYSIINCISKEKSPILGSIRYLTNLARREIKNEVNKNRLNVERGGKIGFIPTIKAYIKLQKYPFDYSPWAVLYFAIRCDVRDELFSFLDENKAIFSDNIKLALETHFQHLPLQESVADDLEKYQGRYVTMQKIDPFKAMILSILTGKHIIPDSSIIKSPYEWLWVRMQFINEDNYNSEFDDVLHKLQEEMKDNHLEDRSNPFLSGQLYLLINQYQKAAEWFLRYEDNINDCLHIVISMNIANLIDDKCLIKPLLLYTKEVFKSDKTVAIRYLSLLHDKDSVIDSIAKLVVEINNGEEIFNPVGNEIPVISKVIYPDLQHQVMLRAAMIAEYRGMHGKAAKIFKMIRDCKFDSAIDHIIDLECIELRKYIQGFLDDTTLEESRLIYLELHSELNYIDKDANKDPSKSNAIKVSTEKLDTMRILLRFSRAFLHFRTEAYREAADEIESAEFLPYSEDKAQEFREIAMANPELRKALPEMITIAICTYAELKEREKVDAILEFASDIDLPNYVQKKLLDLSFSFQ